MSLPVQILPNPLQKRPLQKRPLFRWIINPKVARPGMAKSIAINLIDTSSTKKRSASTHKDSGRGKKACKTTPSAPSARVDTDAEDVGTQFHKTPGTIPSGLS